MPATCYVCNQPFDSARGIWCRCRKETEIERRVQIELEVRRRVREAESGGPTSAVCECGATWLQGTGWMTHTAGCSR